MSWYTYECILMSYRVKHLETVLKLLAEPNRLRILYSLGLDCRPVTSIVEATGLSQTNVSFHLRLLREAGLVRPERRGSFVYYCLPDIEFLALLENLGDWATRRSARPRSIEAMGKERGKGSSKRHILKPKAQRNGHQ